MMARYVINGGVAGGATTAARLRRIDEKSEIVLFERGQYISYANCGLPYYIGETIKEWDNLFVQTPESFNARFNVDVRVNHEVIKIDPQKKEVYFKNLLTLESGKISYDKLVLSPGADPFKPPLPGIDDPRIFTLRNPKDTLNIKNYIKDKKVKKAVIVGAGFIGLEMAENLYNLGLLVTLIEMAPQVMPQVDFEIASEIHQHLKTKGVEFYLNDSVASFDNKEEKIGINLKSGKTIYSDMVILSIGVRPESNLAKDAGLKIGTRGGILVNEYLQTSDPDIYAIGDAIEGKHLLLDENLPIPLAGPANKQGRIVADNIVFGPKRKYIGSIGTAIAKVFDLTVASTGLSEKTIMQKGINYDKTIIHVSSHAGYYPGALPLTLKLLFNKDNKRILGAQIVGYEGVDKRIDVMAALIQKDGTIEDMLNFEHAYAPPYSSAKDPINIAGFVAENVLNGNMKQVHWHDLISMDKNSIFLLDVRTNEEYSLGTIPGAVNIPVDELRKNLNRIPKDKKIVIFCGVGLRGYVAYRILAQNGFENIYNLSGGYKTYEHITQKQSNEDIFEKDYIGKDDIIYQSNPMAQNLQNQIIERNDLKEIVTIDACGLQCPGPILRLKTTFDNLNPGQIVEVKATDPGFKKDVSAWVNLTKNTLISLTESSGIITAKIQKGMALISPSVSQSLAKNQSISNLNDSTIIVFSDDMDKALASFVLALGAASTGRKVTMFFTFWGLSVIKKRKKSKVKKDFMGKMFSLMLPKHSGKLHLSKLNMLNMGPMMMKMRMKQKNVDQLDKMIQQAIDTGIVFVACQMSMDIMGVKKEELLDNVKIGGVATYMEAAATSSLNLFI
ncbi:MAG: CoA-disulfide reductase [Spirochaetota bacterium]